MAMAKQRASPICIPSCTDSEASAVAARMNMLSVFPVVGQ